MEPATDLNADETSSTPFPVTAAASLDDLERELSGLRDEVRRLETDALARVGTLHPAWRASAANLLHYVALRRRDLRDLQERLAELGLSSLGRSESHVLANVDAVLRAIRGLSRRPAVATFAGHRSGPSYRGGARLLSEHADALLGPPPASRSVRILVTLPGDAADDYSLLRELVANGMDCVRINCAHDDAAAWTRMIANVRRAQRDVGSRCRVLMDLAGPKLRTGAIAPGPRVLKWTPERDAFGRILAPARIWLQAEDVSAVAPAPADVSVPVQRAWLAALRLDDHVSIVDARGAQRVLDVGPATDDGAWAYCVQTAYVTPGTRLRIERGDADPRETSVGEIVARDAVLRVNVGDPLVVTRPEVPGHAAERDARGLLVAPASIPCTLPEVFADVHPGERIFFDDGRVGGLVRMADADHLVVEITHGRPKGERLRPDKGINLPDTDLTLPALTPRDLADVEFVARHADAVALSFVRNASDVDALRARLAEVGAPDLGVVLKIETRQGFEHLPDLLLAAMRGPRVGVMIARGDLAVECGYERLAELQEEILWLCEAAHVPAIWATQVLESLSKDGRPSRAEITDAAMGERAECVMLNKGPHVAEAVRALDDILVRMTAHQHKKSSMLRPLRLARAFDANG